MNYSSPQFLIAAGAVAVFVLWYKGYLDGFIAQLGFGSSAKHSGDDEFLRAVGKAMDDAERAAKREMAERMRVQIQDSVRANFGAAGPNTQAPSTPANPAPAGNG